MVFEVTLGNVIAMLVAVIAAMWALFKLVSVQQERRLNERFDTLGAAMKGVAETQARNAEATLDLERQFLQFQATLPLQYVRQEDYVRGQSIVEAKLDGLAGMITNVQLRAALKEKEGSR